LEILGVPSNQFWNQEPGGNAKEILDGLKYVRPGRGFVPNFPLFQKVAVNGVNQHDVYKWAKSRCPSPHDDFRPRRVLLYDPLNSRDIRWNFEKILIDKNGQPKKRYKPKVTPGQLVRDIQTILNSY